MTSFHPIYIEGVRPVQSDGRKAPRRPHRHSTYVRRCAGARDNIRRVRDVACESKPRSWPPAPPHSVALPSRLYYIVQTIVRRKSHVVVKTAQLNTLRIGYNTVRSVLCECNEHNTLQTVLSYLFHDNSPNGERHPSILLCKLLAVIHETKLTLTNRTKP